MAAASAPEWAHFNEVKEAMAEEERELSTDEEDVVAPDRDVLLQAAADRMKRESEQGDPPAQAGAHSAEFDERVSSVFGGLGGAQVQEGLSLRFWTSIHAGAGARAGAAAQAAAPPEAGGEEPGWNPMDDLDDLDDLSEEDLSQLEDEDEEGEGQGNREPAARKRPQAEPARAPPAAGADGKRARKPRVASVTFGADTVVTIPQQPRPEGVPALASGARGLVGAASGLAERAAQPAAGPALVQRAGYQHYNLAEVDADASANRRAASDAMEAVRALQMETQ